MLVNKTFSSISCFQITPSTFIHTEQFVLHSGYVASLCRNKRLAASHSCVTATYLIHLLNRCSVWFCQQRKTVLAPSSNGLNRSSQCDLQYIEYFVNLTNDKDDQTDLVLKIHNCDNLLFLMT